MIVSVERSSAIAKVLIAISVLAVLGTMSLPMRVGQSSRVHSPVIAR